MEVSFAGPTGQLVGWLAKPEHPAYDHAGAIIVTGFPSDEGGGANSFKTFPGLADRVASDARLTVLSLALRGTGRSEGNFSLLGWRDDLSRGIRYLRQDHAIGPVWLVGFGTGGALALDAAYRDPRIAGVITFAAPADFSDWAKKPRELLSHARRCGAINDPEFPPNANQWAKELQQVSAVKAAEGIGATTPLLVMHGTADDAAPSFDAFSIADAHGAAELLSLIHISEPTRPY